MFTLPNFPRADVVPSDTANVLWTQPEDSEIFASFRDDIRRALALRRRPPQAKLTSGGRASSASRRARRRLTFSSRTASQNICVS